MRFSILRFKAWKFMRDPKRKEFTIWQLRRSLECPDRSIRNYVETLLKEGYLEILQDLSQNGSREFSYRLCKDTGPCTPYDRGDGTIYDPNLAGRIELGQQRMWNALRIAHCCLTKEELAVRAETSVVYCGTYLRALARHGYLRAEGRPKMYFLTRDTGPFYPAWHINKLFDQNLATYMEIKDASVDS